MASTIDKTSYLPCPHVMAHRMKRLPPLPALHTFWVTAHCCNFTRAAEHLHITQGAVSRQIAGLERHLGYPLFLRQARGLSLTEQGRAWQHCAQQVFGLIGDAVAAGGTVVVSSHELDRVAALSPRMVTLAGGAVVDGSGVDVPPPVTEPSIGQEDS